MSLSCSLLVWVFLIATSSYLCLWKDLRNLIECQSVDWQKKNKKEQFYFVSSWFDSRTGLFASGEHNAWAQGCPSKREGELDKEDTREFNQSDGKFISCCGKTLQSGSFQKSPAPAILLGAQKVQQEQQDFWLDQFSLWCPGWRKLSGPLQNSSSGWTSALGKGWIAWSWLFQETIICLSEMPLHAVIAINSLSYCKHYFPIFISRSYILYI